MRDQSFELREMERPEAAIRQLSDAIRVRTDPPGGASEDDDELNEVLVGGLEVAGSVGGAALGLVGGPVGMLGGAALGPIAVRALKAAIGAGLAWRARDRAAGAALLIAAEEQQRSRDGEFRRGDGFFDAQGDLRPEAESLLEGVLREAAASFDERKVRVLARFYAALEYDESVSSADAYYLLRQIGQMTYRQIVALSVVAQRDKYERELSTANRGQVQASGLDLRRPHPTLDPELAELADRGLLGISSGARIVRMRETFDGIQHLSQIGYGKLRLLPAAEQLMAMIGDEMISEQQQREWLEQLRGVPR